MEQTDNSNKACVECNHYFQSVYPTQHQVCKLFHSKPDIVTGQVEWYSAREYRINTCGIEGKYFEPIPKSWLARLFGK